MDLGVRRAFKEPDTEERLEKSLLEEISPAFKEKE